MNRNLLFSILMFIFVAVVVGLGIWRLRQPSQVAIGTPTDNGIETVSLNGLRFDQSGLTYNTGALDAPFDFNVLVAEWTYPVEITLEIRTGRDGEWSEWIPLLHSHDLRETTSDGHIGDFVAVSAEAGTHNQIEFRTYSDIGVLQEVQVTFIDSTSAPTADEAIALEAERQESLGIDLQALTVANPKPSVISRDIWCTDAACEYNSCMAGDNLEYEEVSHLILHHTVTSNSSADWPSIVLAIFRYHALSSGNCWGDIGYNYLIDPNGVIYEGHRGGDNVVGTHASQANWGSMGVALIGTFTWPSEFPGGIQPPSPMVDSLVDIYAWKADEQEIDVFGAGSLPRVGPGRPNLMGHRDVFGTTTCPGGQAHALIPQIKDRVGDRLTWLDNNYVYVDEVSSRFSFSNSNWIVPGYQCGYDTHSYLTWSTTDPNQATYWGEWRFDVPASGVYEIEAFIPYCNTGRSETSSAAYTVTHADGVSTVIADQNSSAGLWLSLGSFELTNNSDHQLRLTDLTQDNGLGIWFDDIRLKPVDVTAGAITLTGPADGEWINAFNPTLTWDVSGLDVASSLRVYVSTDPELKNVVADETLGLDARTLTLNLPTDTTTYYWQVVGQGPIDVNSAVHSFSIDQSPPTTQIGRIISFIENRYQIAIESDDDGAPITEITVEYRPISTDSAETRAATEWINLYSGPPVELIEFISPDAAITYEFRISAVDSAGNNRPFSDDADASTEEAIIFDNRLNLPIISR